jgi:RNA polymerase sigma-70 factor, ECF subfamily
MSVAFRATVLGLGLTAAAATGHSPERDPSRSMGQPGARAVSPDHSGAIGDSAIGDSAIDPKPATRILDEVMHRYASGDDEALDELYRLGAPRVRAFLARLCVDSALADDLTQDAFLRIHRARGNFASGAAALPWMLAIARNAFRDHVRHERVRRAHQASAAQGKNGRHPAHDNGGDQKVIARQMLGIAGQALANLPVRQREAFVLLRFEGLSLDEAAQVLGATRAAVKILTHRACVAIREALDRENNERDGPV